MSWTLEEWQKYMDDHIASIEKFVPAPNAMQNIPDRLKQDLYERMEYLHGGICGDMEERQYVYMKNRANESVELTEEQSKRLNKYHHRAYDQMATVVLECSNNENADWREMVKVLVNSEKYFRKLLTPVQLKEYEKSVETWVHEYPMYMTNKIYNDYQSLLKEKQNGK